MSRKSVYLNVLCRWFWGTLQSEIHLSGDKGKCVNWPMGKHHWDSLLPAAQSLGVAWVWNQGPGQQGTSRASVWNKISAESSHFLIDTHTCEGGRNWWAMAWQYSGAVPRCSPAGKLQCSERPQPTYVTLSHVGIWWSGPAYFWWDPSIGDHHRQKHPTQCEILWSCLLWACEIVNCHNSHWKVWPHESRA